MRTANSGYIRPLRPRYALHAWPATFRRRLAQFLLLGLAANVVWTVGDAIHYRLTEKDW